MLKEKKESILPCIYIYWVYNRGAMLNEANVVPSSNQ